MNANYIKAKFLGVVKAIEKMPDSIMAEEATPMLIHDYNSASRMVKEIFPELEDLMPPEATGADRVMGGKRTDHRNIDIYIACSQIYRVLEEVENA